MNVQRIDRTVVHMDSSILSKVLGLCEDMVCMTANTLALEQCRKPEPWRHVVLRDQHIGAI